MYLPVLSNLVSSNLPDNVGDQVCQSQPEPVPDCSLAGVTAPVDIEAATTPLVPIAPSLIFNPSMVTPLAAVCSEIVLTAKVGLVIVGVFITGLVSVLLVRVSVPARVARVPLKSGR